MRLLVFIILFCSHVVWAAGPEKVATLDRTLWSEAINSQQSFDHASMNEILVFVRVMDQTPLKTKADIQKFTSLDKVNLDAVHRWQKRIQSILVKNYQHACQSCAIESWNALVEHSVLPAEIEKELRWKAQWRTASEKFHHRYLYEQVRLAALFPRITSEIDTFSEQEVTGFEFDDGEFLLTYDDGPSKRTSSLISALNQHNIHAFFFVLGETLHKANSAPELYAKQCLASHGYVHKSHQKMSDWAGSLEQTRNVLATYQPAPYWFRPPYGQRSVQLLDNLKAHDERLMLWNIDSQDWNRKLSDRQVQDRVLTLMLLWRRGGILYHDLHSRAQHNLSALNDVIATTHNQWLDCRDL